MQYFRVLGNVRRRFVGYAATATLLGYCLVSAGCSVVAGSSMHSLGPYDCGTPSEMIERVNEYRMDQGRSALEILPELQTSAQNKADDMVDYNYFSHDTPYGKRWYEFFTEEEIPNGWKGENMAANSKHDPSEEALKRWKSSQGHNANMLNEFYTHIGVGISFGKTFSSKNTCNYIQQFWGPADQHER